MYEKNPKKTYCTHFSPVHLDSCVECFVNFSPSTCDRYFNFETNAVGAMNVSFRRDHYDFVNFTEEEVVSFNITPCIYEDYWETSYEIPLSLIKKYVPEFELKDGSIIKTNMYKCGDETSAPHYLSLFSIGTPGPDFHRPEFFEEMELYL